MSLLGTALRVAGELLIDLVSGKLEPKPAPRRPRKWTRQIDAVRDAADLIVDAPPRPTKPQKS